MNIGKKMEKAINDQIQAELYSGYMYLAMAAYFEAQNLKGCAHWMKKQAEEEQEHAMKFFGYVAERGGRVTLQAIQAPKTDWASPLAAFEDAYAHEQKVTSLIYGLYEVALKEKDYTSQTFLQWYLTEQVEEEADSSEIVEKLKAVQGAPQGLLMLDRELGQRG